VSTPENILSLRIIDVKFNSNSKANHRFTL
jgi:hypothetical protein